MKNYNDEFCPLCLDPITEEEQETQEICTECIKEIKNY